MKMISIPESDWQLLQEENNSLRELVSQFVGKATKLIPADQGAKKSKPPRLRASDKMAGMNAAQLKDHFRKKYKI